MGFLRLGRAHRAVPLLQSVSFDLGHFTFSVSSDFYSVSCSLSEVMHT